MPSYAETYDVHNDALCRTCSPPLRLPLLCQGGEEYPAIHTTPILHSSILHPYYIHTTSILHSSILHPYYIHTTSILHPSILHPFYTHPYYTHPSYIHTTPLQTALHKSSICILSTFQCMQFSLFKKIIKSNDNDKWKMTSTKGGSVQSM